MPKLGLGLSLPQTRPSSGEAPITTSRAFNSTGGQVGSTITGDIPNSWLDGQTTVTSVIFANDNSVTIIGDNAIATTQITSITIPNSVTNIGDYAFFLCTSLATATIGNSVTSIGNYAFSGCTSLASITIPSNVTSIGSYVFQNCTSFSTALCYVAQSAFTGSQAFYGTATPLTIRARSTDASWTAGTELSFQGNPNVTVIKNL